MKDSLTIYYTDDDIVDQEIFEEVIESFDKNISLRLHTSGEELIADLQTTSIFPDLVFLDLNMPQRNGFDILQDLQRLNKKDLPPVIIFTTSNDDKHIEQSKMLGARLYIEKPRHYETFVKTLHSIICTKWS